MPSTLPLTVLVVLIGALCVSSLRVRQEHDLPVPTTNNDPFPCPFARSLNSSASDGNDVIILQTLLLRCPKVLANRGGLRASGEFDESTGQGVKTFQSAMGLPVTGVADADTLTQLVELYENDGWVDPLQFPLPVGYLFKIHVPVHTDRSQQSLATVYDSDGNVLMQFTAHTQGQLFSTTGEAIPQLCTSGSTPTGLSTADLNTPESDPYSYGPWNIVRSVQGLTGNAALLESEIRNGILVHTGEWPGVWNTTYDSTASYKSEPELPNSHGCIHAFPERLKELTESVLTSLGVVANENVGGVVPYPYTPQGLLSVELVD